MISIKIFICSLFLFLLMFIFHVIFWRIFKPKKQILLLMINFIVLPFIISLFIFIINVYYKSLFVSNFDLIASMVLYFSFAGVYIQTYPAIQAWSPSLYIVYIIADNRKIKIDDIKRKLNNENLILNRLNDLVDEGFIVIEDKKIILTAKGSIVSFFFYYYRKILGLKLGKG